MSLPACIEINAAGDLPEISIRGVIGSKFDPVKWTVSNTEEAVLAELAKIDKGKNIRCLVNSKGGDFGLALGVYNAFRRRGNITTVNEGYALSAASVVMCGGSKVVSPKSSQWMIHRASAMVAGDTDQMRKAMDALAVSDDVMAGIYAERTGKPKKEMAEMMVKETWMSGEKAKEMGFCDDCDEDPDMDTKASAEELAIVACYQNTPEDLRRKLTVSNDAGGTPATVNQPKGTEMKNIITALVAAGYQLAADATEDTVLAQISALVKDRDTFKNKNADLEKQATEAHKLRIEAHVQAKVDAKIIGAELKGKWVEAILKDDGAQALLDAMATPAAEQPKGHRGAAPAPADPSAAKSDQDKLNDIRAQMATEKDPAKISALAIEARKLRGHGDIFDAEQKTTN